MTNKSRRLCWSLMTNVGGNKRANVAWAEMAMRQVLECRFAECLYIVFCRWADGHMLQQLNISILKRTVLRTVARSTSYKRRRVTDKVRQGRGSQSVIVNK
jgi:hypothetical protein